MSGARRRTPVIGGSKCSATSARRRPRMALARPRRRHTSGLLPTDGDYRDFVRSLDAKNERWVLGAGGLSQRVVVELLRWSGDQVDQFYRSIDLEGSSGVIWASGGSVPRWFDLCRDLTERWVHQRHIRDAVGRPGDHDRFLADVLRTFVWAFPHQYTADAPDGTIVQIGLGVGGTWHLVRSDRRWNLEGGPQRPPKRCLICRGTSRGDNSQANRSPKSRSTLTAQTTSSDRYCECAGSSPDSMTSYTP